MAQKRIRVRINRDGRVEIKVENAVGDECLAFTRGLEAALGVIESRQRLDDGRDLLWNPVPDHVQDVDTL